MQPQWSKQHNAALDTGWLCSVVNAKHDGFDFLCCSIHAASVLQLAQMLLLMLSVHAASSLQSIICSLLLCCSISVAADPNAEHTYSINHSSMHEAESSLVAAAFMLIQMLSTPAVLDLNDHQHDARFPCCSIHAASVLQLTQMLVNHGGMPESLINKYVKYSCLFAAMVHDYQHGGLNNDFLIKTHHPFALLYNDLSPLENHHCAATCKLVYEPEFQYLPVGLPHSACLPT